MFLTYQVVSMGVEMMVGMARRRIRCLTKIPKREKGGCCLTWFSNGVLLEMDGGVEGRREMGVRV